MTACCIMGAHLITRQPFHDAFGQVVGFGLPGVVLSLLMALVAGALLVRAVRQRHRVVSEGSEGG